MIAAAVGCLILGLQNSAMSSQALSHLWNLGFGQINPESLIAWGQHSLLSNIVVANFPQALLSFNFLVYNSLLTCMIMGKEWINYSDDRKPLRVTLPQDYQRSTYRLQLPYKYGAPLLLLSALLHWLASQSLFLVKIIIRDPNGWENSEYSQITMGYSPIAITAFIAVSALAFLIAIMIGFRRYRPGIPIMGCSSLAISAQCHRPQEDSAAAIKPVMWGAPLYGYDDIR